MVLNKTNFQEDRYRQLVSQILEERFPDAFRSMDIVLEPSVNFDDEDYIHTYIIFDGDFKKLDVSKVPGISPELWPEAREMGFVGYPIQSFVQKSEWVRAARNKTR